MVTPGSSTSASTYGTTRFNCNADAGTAIFEVMIQEEAAHYIFIDCNAAKSGEVSVFDENGALIGTYDASLGEPYIIDAGALRPGCFVSVSITTESAVSGNIFVAALNNTASQIEKL